MRSKPFLHVFSIIDLAQWAPRIKKKKNLEAKPKTNEAARLIFFLIQLSKIAWF
jgi:hypothetical protein